MVRSATVLAILFLTMGFMGACGRAETRAADAGLYVTLIPDAGGIDGEHMVVRLTDAAGQPITDRTVSLEGNMTHAGMVPVLSESVWDGADGSEDGAYRVPFQFTMLGDWIITVQIEPRTGDVLTEEIRVTVGSDQVEVTQ